MIQDVRHTALFIWIRTSSRSQRDRERERERKRERELASSERAQLSTLVSSWAALFACEQKSTLAGQVCALSCCSWKTIDECESERASAFSFMWSVRTLSLALSLSLCQHEGMRATHTHTHAHRETDDRSPPPPLGFHSRNSCFCQTAKRSSALVMPLSVCVWATIGSASVCVCVRASQVDRLPIGAFLADPATAWLHLHSGPQLIDLDRQAWLGQKQLGLVRWGSQGKYTC